MEKLIQVIAAGVLAWFLMGAMATATEKKAPKTVQKASPGNDVALVKMIKTAMRSAVMVQIVAKNYLYAGNDIATTKAKRAIKSSFEKFDVFQKKLANAFADPKSKNLMMFINMNADELKDLVIKPYSLDSAQEVIDLAEAISEGERKLAATFRKKLSRNYPVGKGQRYSMVQIGKYYMAYQAGIKDANTVRQMKKTVANVEGFIKSYKAYPRNTVEMNQIINRIDKLWQIVKQFYLDIEEGGLPIIVYQTTEKLDKAVINIHNLSSKLSAKNKPRDIP